MFEGILDAFQQKKVPWLQLRPGMVYVGGVQINGVVPYELRGFPVLTGELLDELYGKYQFLRDRSVQVLDSDSGFDPVAARRLLADTDKRIGGLEVFRQDHFSEKEQLLGRFAKNAEWRDFFTGSAAAFPGEPGAAAGVEKAVSAAGLLLSVPLLHTPAVDPSHLVADRFSSFSIPYNVLPGDMQIPSMFGRPDLQATLENLFSGRLAEKLNLPKDREIRLHIVIDYSYSMEQNGKLKVAVDTANYLHKKLQAFLKNTDIRLYVFSNTAREAGYPLRGKEIPKRDTNYAAFMKKVLANRAGGPGKGVRDKVILITDGEPSDRNEALLTAEKLRVQKVDYTQIIFDFNEELEELMVLDGNAVQVRDGYADRNTIDDNAVTRQMTPEELDRRKQGLFDTFTRIAETAGGNQIIIRVYEMLKLLSVEVYDRYLGLLTLATDAEVAEVERTRNDRPRQADRPGEKPSNIKPFRPPKL